jgi:NAD-specific glutamate dehydrogenase
MTEGAVQFATVSAMFVGKLGIPSPHRHVQRRTVGSADIRVINPMMPDGREISVLEVLNDNMPFMFDSTMAELAEQGIELTLVAHPIIEMRRSGGQFSRPEPSLQIRS